MTTEKAAEKKLPGWKRLYGFWAIMPSLCINCWCGYGMWYTSFGPFLTKFVSVFGVSRTVATGAQSTGNILQVTGPLMGMFLDKVGYRKACTVAVIVMMIGCLFIAFSAAPNYWMIYVAYILMAPLGLNIPTYGGASKTVNSWFLKRRGLMMGILTAVTGFVYMSAAIQGFFIDRGGIAGGAWYVFALGIPMLLVTIFVIRNKASDFGVGLDGAPLTAKTATDGGQKAPAKPKGKEGKVVAKFSYVQALRSPNLWLILFSYSFIVQLANTFTVGNYVAFLQGFGMGAGAAGAIWGMMGICGIPARFVWGPLMDLTGRGTERFWFALGIFMMAIGVVGLLQVHTAQDFFWVWWWTAWWGLGYGGCMTALLVIFASYWGPGVYGSVFGTKGVLQGIAGFIGPLMGGVVYDMTGSYTMALWICVVILVVSTVIMCLAAAPKMNADGTPFVKAKAA